MATRNSLAYQARRRAIISFSEKVGLVYFGSVDQHEDDHHSIRGLTASATHEDSNYSVGSFEGYDVSIVDRLDTLDDNTGHHRTHQWLLFAIDLHAGNDVPHLFLGTKTRDSSAYTKLFAAFPHFQAAPLGALSPYPQEFTSRYELYCTPLQFIEAENFITPSVSQTIAAHFWPLSVEVFEGSLYLYAGSASVSQHLLETMLKNGLWLARQLDATLESVD